MINSKSIDHYYGEPDKERLLSAFKIKPVDRVPNFDVLFEDKHVEKLLGKFAGNTLAYGGEPSKGADAEQGRPMYPDDYLDLCTIIGQDAMIFNAGFWTPYMRKDDSGNLIPAYSRNIKNKSDYKKLTIDSGRQIENSIKYLEEYKEAIVRRNTKIGVGAVYGCIFQTLYEFVVGMNDFMMMVYEDRDLIEEMLEESTKHFINLTQALVKKKIDFIRVADDIAFKTGLFIPPKIMKEIWVPRIARIIEPGLDSNIPVMFHSDGRIDDIVEDLIEIGVDCINPMDPYGINYADYKKRYGNRLCLSGNVDIEFPLSKGTPEDIEKDVKEHMDILKPNYGYVASVSHSVVNYIPHGNLIAYLNSIHKYGIYK
jgi:uroporphyrinogen-III decarboxylase